MKHTIMNTATETHNNLLCASASRDTAQVDCDCAFRILEYIIRMMTHFFLLYFLLNLRVYSQNILFRNLLEDLAGRICYWLLIYINFTVVIILLILLIPVFLCETSRSSILIKIGTQGNSNQLDHLRNCDHPQLCIIE